jgi:hypothetical protein
MDAPPLNHPRQWPILGASYQEGLFPAWMRNEGAIRFIGRWEQKPPGPSGILKNRGIRHPGPCIAAPRARPAAFFKVSTRRRLPLAHNSA